MSLHYCVGVPHIPNAAIRLGPTTAELQYVQRNRTANVSVAPIHSRSAQARMSEQPYGSLFLRPGVRANHEDDGHVQLPAVVIERTPPSRARAQ